MTKEEFESRKPQILEEVQQAPLAAEEKFPGGGLRSFLTIPEPSEDQKEYVRQMIKWREDSYDPDQEIGGPKKPTSR